MTRQVAILHGWSDASDSFDDLAGFLRSNGYRAVPIFLGDYISLRDDVRIADVAKQMEEVFADLQVRGQLARSFDMIVHSTGGLLARDWISTWYADRPCPVKNLVMLAPANFGSKLAHMGRSMLGRVLKGWRTGFETGEEMLRSLELASEYQWDLAQSDLFVPAGWSAGSAPAPYGRDSVRVFVITGTVGYPGAMSGLVNEPGADGTVRVAAANLNAYGRTVDFSGGPDLLSAPEVTEWRKRGGTGNRFPLAVLPDRNHGDIVRPTDPGASNDTALRAQLGELILEALRATPGSYARIRDRWREEVCMPTRRMAGAEANERARIFGADAPDADCFHEHFQLVVRVEDEFGEPIPDYFLTFTGQPRNRLLRLVVRPKPSSAFFHEKVLADAHSYRPQNANRCFFVDRYEMMRPGGFYDRIEAGHDKALAFTVTAADPGGNISYFTPNPKDRGVIEVHQQGRGARWLKRHSTHFIHVIVPRAAKSDVFTLSRAGRRSRTDRR